MYDCLDYPIIFDCVDYPKMNIYSSPDMALIMHSWYLIYFFLIKKAGT